MSNDPDSILGLAKSIGEKAQLVTDALIASNQRPPSIHNGVEPAWPVRLSEVRATLLDDIAKLQQLIADPRETLMDSIQPEMSALNIIIHFSVARAVPLNDAADYSAVAAVTGLPEPELRRVLKLVMMRRIFREVKGKIAHTATSRMLATDQDLIDWADVSYQEILPAKLKTSHALRAFPGSDKTRESGFALANEHLDMFSYFQAHPDRAKAFASGMNAVHKRRGFELEFLVDNMPSREKLERGGICVDVGGGNGATMLAMALAIPRARCIVQDLSGMIESHVKIPDEVKSRVQFVAHDFFTDQPVRGASVYLLRNVLHNWPDDKCLEVLRKIADAMNASSRMLINDWCIEDDDVDNSDVVTARKKREMDINMLSLFNAGERSVKKWEKLIVDARCQLVLESVAHPRGSNYSLISVRRREGNADDSW